MKLVGEKVSKGGGGTEAGGREGGGALQLWRPS